MRTTIKDNTTAEEIGIDIARHFKWDGRQIMEAFLAALTDANFHTEAKAIQQAYNRGE
jgi:phosphopantetheinyl transferase